MILKFFDRSDKSSNKKFETSLHILDIYRSSLLSFTITNKPEPSKWDKVRGMLYGDCISSSKKNKKKKFDKEYHMRPATDLAEAGIQCVKLKGYVDQISFHRGKLRLPPIWVDDATKTIYLNMMAFEWLHVNRWLSENVKPNEGYHVTSYVFLMDRLIDTAKDVSLLHKHRIMQYAVGSDQSVADIFNSLSMDMCVDWDNELLKVHKSVAKYYRKPVPGCIAYAKRTYFANTWVTLSIFAAIFLFALTITQTLYAVLDYHKIDAPPPPYHKP